MSYKHVGTAADITSSGCPPDIRAGAIPLTLPLESRAADRAASCLG
jgi:hypothetical protein